MLPVVSFDPTREQLGDYTPQMHHSDSLLTVSDSHPAVANDMSINLLSVLFPYTKCQFSITLSCWLTYYLIHTTRHSHRQAKNIAPYQFIATSHITNGLLGSSGSFIRYYFCREHTACDVTIEVM